MSAHCLRVGLVVAALLGPGANLLPAQPPVDADGDPLPPGAVARLGTLRLRHDVPVVFAAFLPGGKSVLFNTITVSDGISMGTPGMRYSLVSREIIADSIEAVVGAAGMDGFVALGGCDKHMPGCAMAMARLHRPSISAVQLSIMIVRRMPIFGRISPGMRPVSY